MKLKALQIKGLQVRKQNMEAAYRMKIDKWRESLRAYNAQHVRQLLPPQLIELAWQHFKLRLELREIGPPSQHVYEHIRWKQRADHLTHKVNRYLQENHMGLDLWEAAQRVVRDDYHNRRDQHERIWRERREVEGH